MCCRVSNPIHCRMPSSSRQRKPAPREAKVWLTVCRLPGVEAVEDDPAWAGRWRALARLGNSAVLAGGLLAVLAMVAICFNTIRLQVLTRAEEAAVMRLFGATDSQIRRPFLYFGGLQ